MHPVIDAGAHRSLTMSSRAESRKRVAFAWAKQRLYHLYSPWRPSRNGRTRWDAKSIKTLLTFILPSFIFHTYLRLACTLSSFTTIHRRTRHTSMKWVEYDWEPLSFHIPCEADRDAFSTWCTRVARDGRVIRPGQTLEGRFWRGLSALSARAAIRSYMEKSCTDGGWLIGGWYRGCLIVYFFSKIIQGPIGRESLCMRELD